MTNIESKTHHVCPWYMAYLFDNPLRRLIHDPAKMLGPYVKPGMTLLDVGCGMGFFTLGMARLVGDTGKVISLDMQPEMLRIVEKRARRRGLSERIETCLTDGKSLKVGGQADFALCFWMIHEVPDQAAFFTDVYSSLRQGARLFLAEPGIHVTGEEFEKSVQIARGAGFTEVERPRVMISRAVVLRK